MTVRHVTVDEPIGLAEYELYLELAPAVSELRAEAGALVPRLDGRRLWMVNSTPQGGGVAEMLPKMISLLRELGVNAEWLVIDGQRPEFFELTKRLHNLIHGSGPAALDDDDRTLYDETSRTLAAELRSHVASGDIVITHDPQPLGAGAALAREIDVLSVWRCHIGLEDDNAATDAAWRFLQPDAEAYDHTVFSVPEYIPSFLAGRASVVHPGIDPLSHKNRELSPHKLTGVLCNAGLAASSHPVLTPPWDQRAAQLGPDGGWRPAANDRDPGLLFRPALVQVSRWDRLKGFGPLLDAFARLKRRLESAEGRHRRRLRILRLVLAGPDPGGVQDDPEAAEVLEALAAQYGDLPPDVQRDVVLLRLPMASRKENALMVNALQRCATVVVQNSLQEGFGLTVTEAMWKGVAVAGSRAAGIRRQLRDEVDGRLLGDPTDPDAVAEALDTLLAEPRAREAMGRHARRRVQREFLVFAQLRRWLRVLAECCDRS